jgi:hypothetical protein
LWVIWKDIPGKQYGKRDGYALQITHKIGLKITNVAGDTEEHITIKNLFVPSKIYPRKARLINIQKSFNVIYHISRIKDKTTWAFH